MSKLRKSVTYKEDDFNNEDDFFNKMMENP